MELKDVQEWEIKPQLRTIPGVSCAWVSTGDAKTPLE
jgi:Cu/Ag efflux pump CusA